MLTDVSRESSYLNRDDIHRLDEERPKVRTDLTTKYVRSHMNHFHRHVGEDEITRDVHTSHLTQT